MAAAKSKGRKRRAQPKSRNKLTERVKALDTKKFAKISRSVRSSTGGVGFREAFAKSKKIPARFREAPASAKKTAARFKEAPPASKKAATRFREAAPVFKEAATRFREAAPLSKKASARFRKTSVGFKEAF